MRLSSLESKSGDFLPPPRQPPHPIRCIPILGIPIADIAPKAHQFQHNTGTTNNIRRWHTTCVTHAGTYVE